MIKECNATQIITNLWLSNMIAAQNYEFIKKYNVQYIINFSAQKIKYFESVTYININLHDDDIKQYSCNNVWKLFELCNKIIHNCLSNNIAILVNCKRGHHRSASIVAAYLIKYNSMSFFDTLKFIRSKRYYALNKKKNIIKCLYEYYLDVIR